MYELNCDDRLPSKEASHAPPIQSPDRLRPSVQTAANTPPPPRSAAQLSAETVIRHSDLNSVKSVDVKLTEYRPDLSHLSKKNLAALQDRADHNGLSFIDFWAIDFDWHPGQPFHHDWHDYRTRKDRALNITSDAGHSYAVPGRHTILIRVTDIFGHDSQTTLDVSV